MNMPGFTAEASLGNGNERYALTLEHSTNRGPKGDSRIIPAGTCYKTSGCSTGCCTTGANGKCYCDYCCVS